MRLKTLIQKALKLNPIAAEMTLKSGAAIVFIGEDDVVYVIEANMGQELFETICHHITQQRDVTILRREVK